MLDVHIYVRAEMLRSASQYVCEDVSCVTNYPASFVDAVANSNHQLIHLPSCLSASDVTYPCSIYVLHYVDSGEYDINTKFCVTLLRP